MTINPAVNPQGSREGMHTFTQTNNGKGSEEERENICLLKDCSCCDACCDYKHGWGVMAHGQTFRLPSGQLHLSPCTPNKWHIETEFNQIYSSSPSQILFLLPNLLLCLQHPYCAVRHLAARCIGVLSVVSTQETMRMVVEDILPLMGTADIIRNRQGAVEAISCILCI